MRRSKGGVVVEDRLLDAAQLAARLEPELLDQMFPGPLVGGEGVRLPAAAVQRHHQVAPQPLAERVIMDECLELAHELGVAAHRKIGADAGLDRRGVLLLQAHRLTGEPSVGGDGAEGLTAPQRRRVTEDHTGPRRVAGTHRSLPIAHEGAKSPDVDVTWRNAQRVARRLRGDHLGAERLAQVPDVGLQGLAGRRWRVVTPDRGDQRVRRDHRPGVQRQRRQQRALLGGAEYRTARGAIHQEGAQKTQAHGAA